MTENLDYGLLMLVLGGVVLASVPLRQGLRRVRLPGLIGFVALGAMLSALDDRSGLLTPAVASEIEVLAQLGLVALLFRVGLESDLERLAAELGRAVAIWLPNVILPGLAAFALIALWPGYGMIPALLVGIGATATSIGVSVAPWEEAGALKSDEGALMLDVAQIDDVSAVILLGILFAVAPALQNGAQAGIWAEIAGVGGLKLLKIIGFSSLCYVFSRVVEPHLSALFARLDARLGPFTFAAGAVFVIAAIADALGFSMAIGALFAGLAFSRDPAERRIDAAFAPLLAVFGPFFFLSIGLSLDFATLGAALPLALALFGVLVLSKMIGAGLPAGLIAGRRAGRLVGASMIPRAEIYLVVMMHGLSLGAWAMPQTLYSAAVLAAIGSCIAGPLLVGRLLAGRDAVASDT